MVWHGMIDVCDGCLAAEASRSSFSYMYIYGTMSLGRHCGQAGVHHLPTTPYNTHRPEEDPKPCSFSNHHAHRHRRQRRTLNHAHLATITTRPLPPFEEDPLYWSRPPNAMPAPHYFKQVHQFERKCGNKMGHLNTPKAVTYHEPTAM